MPIKVTIDPREVFHRYLRVLKNDCWIRNGKVYTEGYTSHRFDMKVGDAADPKFRVLRAVLELEAALKEAKL